jgi:hypothetical protein
MINRCGCDDAGRERMADDLVVRFELKNSQPVELLDLTGALEAFGDAYKDHAVDAGFEVDRGNIKLFVREIRTGSIIADLTSQSDQISFTVNHIDIAAGFLTHLNEIINFFLGIAKLSKETQPSKREASHINQMFEPSAKDSGSQLILQVSGGDVHVHQQFTYNSQQANAVQNAARRYIGPQLPAVEIKHDALLRLHQVRGDVAAKVGDRGIIEEISPTPAKLTFSSEEVKKQVLDQPYPFQSVYVVDAEVKAVDGKPGLYRILSVKDAFQRP